MLFLNISTGFCKIFSVHLFLVAVFIYSLTNFRVSISIQYSVMYNNKTEWWINLNIVKPAIDFILKRNITSTNVFNSMCAMNKKRKQRKKNWFYNQQKMAWFFIRVLLDSCLRFVLVFFLCFEAFYQDYKMNSFYNHK